MRWTATLIWCGAVGHAAAFTLPRARHHPRRLAVRASTAERPGRAAEDIKAVTKRLLTKTAGAGTAGAGTVGAGTADAETVDANALGIVKLASDNSESIAHQHHRMLGFKGAGAGLSRAKAGRLSMVPCTHRQVFSHTIMSGHDLPG